MPKKAFAFHFKNPVQDSGEALTNVLFINNAPAEGDILRLEAWAEPDVTITLNPVDDKVVSDDNYHFKLTFRPDALALPERIGLDASHTALWGLACIPETVQEVSVEEARAPGDVDLYFLYKGDQGLEVTASRSLPLTLRKVGAKSAGGTRPTILQLKLNKSATDVNKFVLLGGPGGDYNDTESGGLDLLAPRVQAVPTLMAGIVSSDIVLNDGATENGLVLRIVNTGLLPLSLSPGGSESPSRFTLRFEANNDTGKLWALGTIAQVGQILIPAKQAANGSWVIDAEWSGHDAWSVTHPADETTWTLTPKAGKTALDPGEALEVPIGKIVTRHATGRTALRIGYSGLPGFGDGELAAFIQKHPLVFAGQQVGVGTGSPPEKLTVKTTASLNEVSYGIAHTNVTSLSIPTTLSTRLSRDRAGLGTLTDHDFTFFTNKSTPQMTLTTGGKVGIGTTDPSEMLTVHQDGAGITHTNGTVKLTTRADGKGGGLGTESPHALYFYAQGYSASPTMTMKDGKLGIGTESPSEKLTVVTPRDSDGITHTDTDGTVKLTTRVDSESGLLGTRSNHHLGFFTNSGNRMLLTASGNLGIGTESPSEKLHVQGNLRVNGELKNQGPFVFRANTDDNPAGEDLARFFDRNDSEVLTLKSDGKLGIGTTTPSSKLEVNGALRVNGDFLINGEKPIKTKRIALGGATYVDTGYSTRDWLAVVAGFHCTHKPNGAFWCYTADRGTSNWWIEAEMDNVTGDNWVVHLIFIRRELVTGDFNG
jgi:hypothetical protein